MTDFTRNWTACAFLRRRTCISWSTFDDTAVYYLVTDVPRPSISLFTFLRNDRFATFWGRRPPSKMGHRPASLKFELGRNFCTMHLPTKFHHLACLAKLPTGLYILPVFFSLSKLSSSMGLTLDTRKHLCLVRRAQIEGT